MEELATVLTHERRLLGELVYRLEALLYFATRDDMELLDRAASEATEVINAVRDADGARAAALAKVAQERRVSPADVTLRALAEDDPATNPMASLFAQLRVDFLSLTAKIEKIQTTLVGSMGSLHRHVETVLNALVGPGESTTATTYGPRGQAAGTRGYAPRSYALSTRDLGGL
jgi:hypothetical protein